MERTPENEYPYLRAWSKLMGAYPYSVEPPVLDAARKEGVSQLVIYKAKSLDSSTGQWTNSPIWISIDKDAPPGSFSDRVLRYVETHYQLSYSQVKAWDTEAMTKEKTKSNDYPYIREWGRLMGSHQYYITSQVEEARRDKAPQTATYKRIPPHGEDWSDRKPSEFWALIDPNAKVINGAVSFQQLAIERAKESFGLTYEDVVAWDKQDEQA